MHTDNKVLKSRIIILCIMILFVFAALFVFIRQNDKRIINDNRRYIEDATKQSASRINDMVSISQKNIQALAYLKGDLPESADIKEKLEGYSAFDHVVYIEKDGVAYSSKGESADISEREYFIEAMKGNSGLCVVDSAKIIGETLFIFYAPVYKDGEIVGVLDGIYRADTIKELISGSFYDVQAKTYICDGSGRVLISAGDSNIENITQFLDEYSGISKEEAHNVNAAFKNHTAYVYSYKTKSGVGSAYAAPLDNRDWMLVQTFPTAVTRKMSSESASMGVILALSVMMLFFVIMMILTALKYRQTKELINEKERVSDIIKSVTNLFARFSLIDLKEDTYAYIKKEEGIPARGKYSELVKYMNGFYVEEENTYPITETASAENIQKNLKKNVPYLQYEYHIVRDGIDKWEHASVICLKREKGVPVSVLYAIQDVTDIKKEEAEAKAALKNAFEAAEAANMAKSDFLSRMSHDIRTPMNAVMGMTAVAAMNIDDKERVIDCLNKINSSGNHLLALINDILDMSKIESGKVTLSEEPFSIAEMTESLLSIMHPQIKAKDQKISMTTSNMEHEYVIGDTLRLRQVFVNIMGNAVKFTPPGGSISMDIREIPSHIKGKACYEFVFTDTGIGMEEEFIDNIFEPFARSSNPISRKIEGSGLGMPISRNIVRMMNGTIKVESKLGVGSKFTVMVYLTIQDVKDSNTEHLENLKILVADDEKEAAENTGEILKSIGMDASWVFTGEEAIEKVVEQHEKGQDYAAVILDWKMPEKNGVETAKEIREKVGEELPIIILSAYDWSDIEQEAREAGVHAFIAKPLFKSRLIYVLNSVMSNEEEENATELSQFAQNDYNGKRVLLAEDNELNREVAGELLNMIGLQVDMAFDGQEAVDMLLEKPQNYYDLVFMDIQMPNKNGYEATREIRASGRKDLENIPIIAMSADAFSDDIYRSLESGMNDHVAKPIEIAKLTEAIKKWLK